MSSHDKPDKHAGTLYIVATPIGNLEDITLRAVSVLKQVSVIAAEDTRRTKKLLNSYQINTPLSSLYEHNEAKKSGAFIAKIIEGYDIAYVSDAGTPGISDPGYLLIQEALANNIRVVPIPGACAAVVALSVSGLPTDSFVFHGFLPAKTGKRLSFIRSLENETKTVVLYESPNRLMATLHDVMDILGDRRIVVTRELTKIYEEIIRGSVAEVIKALQDRVLKGEITVIIGGKQDSGRAPSESDIRRLIAGYKKNTILSERDLIDEISRKSGISRKLVYREIIKAKD
jgi:16S rRNA (cytidine1402-2'-O)-methyltransferase